MICPFSRTSRWNCSLNATFIKSAERETILTRSHSFRRDSWHQFLHFPCSLKFYQFFFNFVTTKSDYRLSIVFEPSTQRRCFLNAKESLFSVRSSLKMNYDSNERSYFVRGSYEYVTISLSYDKLL